MNKKDKSIINDLYEEAFYWKREEIQKMVENGELKPIGEYDKFSEESESEQDAWQYLEHYCYEEDYTNTGEEIANKQGFLEGVAFVVDKLGGKCSY